MFSFVYIPIVIFDELLRNCFLWKLCLYYNIMPSFENLCLMELFYVTWLPGNICHARYDVKTNCYIDCYIIQYIPCTLDNFRHCETIRRIPSIFFKYKNDGDIKWNHVLLRTISAARKWAEKVLNFTTLQTSWNCVNCDKSNEI